VSVAETSGSREQGAPLRWIEAVARQFDGRAESGPGDIRLDVEGPEWSARGLPSSLVLADAPASPEQWTVRLRVLEQMAARVLASPPYFFSLRMDGTGSARGSQEVGVLRVAFGVVLASGRLELTRWTGYSIEPLGWTAVVPATDDLFTLKGLDLWQEGPAPDPSELQSPVERLVEAVARACNAGFRPADQAASQEALSREIRELDFLYFQPDERLPTLRGLAPEAASLDHAVEAEHRSRLGDVVERYSAVLQVRVLSVGWIRCRGIVQRAAGTREVRLPFVTLRENLREG
jgi:hypothetical protein